MRSPDTIITVAITPIMMMLLFVYVFGGAIQTGTDNYVNYLLPGILSDGHRIRCGLHFCTIIYGCKEWTDGTLHYDAY